MRRITVVAVACVALAGCSLQTTGARKGNLHLQARFGDVGALVPGESVDISDVQVGSVTDIRLDRYAAVVTMSIESDQKVPAGTVAVLNQTSLLGEPYVDLRLPTTFDPMHGPWVKSGDRLPTSATVGIEAFAGQAANVVGALTAGDLGAVLQALSQGLGGRGPELNQLIADLAHVTAALAFQQSNLAAVIDNAGRLGASLAGGSPQIGLLIDNLASATTTLAVNRQKLVTTLMQLTRLSGDLNLSVIAPHLIQIEQLIANLSPILSEAAAAKTSVEGLVTGLKTFVQAIPRAISGGSVLSSIWLHGFVNDAGVTTPANVRAPSLTSLLAPPK